MTQTDYLRLDRGSTEGTVRLALSRPKTHNAFDDVLIAELTAALEQLDADPSVRAVVLTGEGSTFSAGADLGWMRRMAQASEAENREDSLKLAKLMRTLNFLSKPTIARVNGSAYGGGVGLVACCDYAIGAEGAKFSLSEVKLGLVPAVISPYVTAAIGPRHARRLFTGAEVIEAPEALAIGLLHTVAPVAELDAVVDRALHFWAKGGPVAQREAKQLALRMAGLTRESAERVDTENAALIARLRVSPEGQEGLTAFLDKRPPNWIPS
ncbi:enoyl-CoA hydratase-related protein [Arenimonas terrae]|uniref:Enoyl-CoA hydratase/isomerase family protein n=1 Tax=Arenimonas terrae TaxID=2546226 RepID=A0A5C4RVI0_9GAMM|nr:enoyl-CoA hydratase-related protein [Arenimonas terrae]TNJ34851.1 enoyl-CoA hydratase/isomerase family protein [Arenimonas terrae]